MTLHESDVAAWNLALSSATEDTDVLSDSDADDPVFKQLAIQTPTKVWQIRKATSDENAKTGLDDTTEEMGADRAGGVRVRGRYGRRAHLEVPHAHSTVILTRRNPWKPHNAVTTDPVWRGAGRKIDYPGRPESIPCAR